MTENQLSNILIGLFIKIHSELGPGLLESIYEKALCYELEKNNLKFIAQKGIPVYYDGVKLDIGFRADVIVEEKVLIELKSVEYILPVHKKITLTYLKLTTIKLALLVNFNENLVKDGIYRIVNNLEED